MLRYVAVLTTVVGLGVLNPKISKLAAAPTHQPQFANYPASPVFKGKPAKLIINNPEAKSFASALEETRQKGTNFAGHYAIADHLDRAMGGRDGAAIIDLKTGRVYLPRELYGYNDLRGAGELHPRPDGGLHYQPNSKLLIIVGSTGSKQYQGFGRYYFKWENNRLNLLKFISFSGEG